MYKSFYGLKEKPFSLLPDPAYLYLSKQHEMAMTLLEYSLENQAGFCVISGKAGTGKTTLLRRLLNQVGNDVSIGLISNTHHSFGELLRWILQAFSLEDSGKTRAQLHQIFVDYLIGQYARNRRTMLIIDEAQNMSPDALEELRMLSNINSEKDLLLQVILVGQSPLREILRRPELEQFAQRIAVDYHLESLSREETQGYIRHRIMVAGGEHELFTEDACNAVFERSSGIPRLINLLCDFSLVYAYASQAAVVTGELVEEVVREREKYGALPVFAVTTEERAKRSLPARETRSPIAANSPDTSMMPAVRTRVASGSMSVAGKAQPENGYAKTVTAFVSGTMHESRIETKVRTREIDTSRFMAPEIPLMKDDSSLAQLHNKTVTPLKDATSENISGKSHAVRTAPQAQPSDQFPAQKPDSLADASSLSEKSLREQAIAPAPENSVAANVTRLPGTGIAKRSSADDGFAAQNRASMTKRYMVLSIFGAVLLSMALIWFFANLRSGPMLAASNNNATRSSAATPVTRVEATPAKVEAVNDRIPNSQPLERITPVSREGAVMAAVEKNPEPEASPKTIERERESALALAKAAEREAKRNAALARERALAAEREIALAREREAALAREREAALAREREAALAREREAAHQAALASAKARNEARAAEAAAVIQGKTPEPVSPPPEAKTADKKSVPRPPEPDISSQKAAVAESDDEKVNEPTTFAANPCKGPSARFLSTCE